MFGDNLADTPGTIVPHPCAWIVGALCPPQGWQDEKPPMGAPHCRRMAVTRGTTTAASTMQAGLRRGKSKFVGRYSDLEKYTETPLIKGMLKHVP